MAVWKNKFVEPSIVLELHRQLMTSGDDEKGKILEQLKEEVGYQDSECSEELKSIGERVIEKYQDREELDDIMAYNIRIDYILSYEDKKKQGKTVLADCRKVQPEYLIYLPYDILITFYEPNIEQLTEEQLETLMLHELLHIGMSSSGIYIKPHDVEEFNFIINKFGLNYLT